MSTEPACGGQVEGVFADDAAQRLWTFPSSLRTTPSLLLLLLLLLLPPFAISTHPSTHQPTLSLPFLHTHTHIHSITNAQGLQQQQQHREMEISAACVSAYSRWVQGQERVSVSDAWMRCRRERRGGEIRVEGRRGISVRTWWGSEAMSFCFFPSPIPITWIFAGCVTTTPAVTAPAASLCVLPQPVRAAPVAGRCPGTRWIHGWTLALQGICAFLSFAPLICFLR